MPELRAILICSNLCHTHSICIPLLVQESRPGRQGLWMMLEELERSEKDVSAVGESCLI